jgi:iron complex transport system substrate-binding protein
MIKTWPKHSGYKIGKIDKNACFSTMLSDMKRTVMPYYIRHYFRIMLILLVGLLMLTACKTAMKKPQGKRYVVLSPEIAEIIAVIEGTGNIMGITEECNFPAEYAGKVVVGKFGTLNKERIIALKPSIVFATSLEQQAITTELSKLGIKVVTLYPKTIDEMLNGIKTIGVEIGKEKRANFVADSLRTELNNLKANTLNKPRPKVYLEIYRDPLMSVSDQSYVGELIELAGGDNIFSKLERDYSRIKAEDVIKAKPEIMICYSQDTKDNIRKRMGWKNLPAIRNDRIYFEKDINPDLILRAGPRCVLGAKRLQELFYNGK